MKPANQVSLSGLIESLGALRHTPAGIAAVEFQLRHESEQDEAGGQRRVQAQIDAVAFDVQARLVAAAPLGGHVNVRGFLCARSKRSKRLVLHITDIEFMEGD